MTRTASRRPAGRRRISVRLVLLVLAVLAFPWALPALLLMALGLAMLVLGLAGALLYAAALWVSAHTALAVALVLLAALAATARVVHRLTTPGALLR